MSTDYTKIDNTRRASFKQLLACSYKLGAILQAELGVPAHSPVTGKRLAGRVKAALTAKHEGNLTHGDVQAYFAADKLPASLRKAIKVDDLNELLKADGHAVKAKPQAKAKPKSRRATTSKAKAVKVTPSIGEILQAVRVMPNLGDLSNEDIMQVLADRAAMEKQQ
jgi:hypothetical protein